MHSENALMIRRLRVFQVQRATNVPPHWMPLLSLARMPCCSIDSNPQILDEGCSVHYATHLISVINEGSLGRVSLNGDDTCCCVQI
jgi:hypothetical protein